MRILHLTSPLMAGPDVREVQTVLHSHGYLVDHVDGEYGPHTAQACYRAMFRLGYRRPSQTVTRPDLLVAYLLGKPQTARMKLRAKARAPRPPKPGELTHGQKIVQQAVSQLGQTEDPPGSNRSKFSLWYGVVGAWCAMYVTWVHVTTHSSYRTFIRAIRYAYVPYVIHDAVAGINGLMVASAPADGILVCFDWDHDGTADHIGICATQATLERLIPDLFAKALAELGPLTATDFWTVEGNTGVGNDSNGGMVMIRRRDRAVVQHFVKVAA